MADIINFNDINKDAQDFKNELEQSINDVKIPESDEVQVHTDVQPADMKPMKVNSIYDTRTGISTPLISDGEIVEDDLSETMDADEVLNTMLNGNSVSVDGLAEALRKNKDINMEGMSIDEISSLAGLINDHLNGVKINNYYSRLPLRIKDIIMSGIAGQVPQNQLKSFTEGAAKQIINDIALDYSLSDSSADLDTLFKELQSANEELTIGIGQLDAQMSIAFVTKNLEELKRHEAAARESGDIEKADKILTSIIEPLEESISLNKFKEFCKTVKIKKFELEKPEKVFKDFNWKYANHRLNINDIHSCPGTLAKHIEGNDPREYIAVCVAFCKYCANYKPDNPAEHAFMYYFIKNILILNIIYPNGIISNSSTEYNLSPETTEFYNTFKSNIKECINNLHLK